MQNNTHTYTHLLTKTLAPYMNQHMHIHLRARTFMQTLPLFTQREAEQLNEMNLASRIGKTPVKYLGFVSDRQQRSKNTNIRTRRVFLNNADLHKSSAYICGLKLHPYELITIVFQGIKYQMFDGDGGARPGDLLGPERGR